MAAGAKKYKIFKICKELNLGHETIINFLEQKKIKVKGPNASVGEDIYIEILERFATDKEKAEKLQARRDHAGENDSEDGAGEDTDGAEGEKSAYLTALQQSIDDGVEAIAKAKDAPEEVKPRKKTAKKKIVEVEAEPEVAKAKEAETPVAVKAEEPVKSVEEAVTEKVEPEKPVDKPVTDKDDADQSAKKSKTKGKKPEQSKGEATVSEKELKRRKALEMVRKEKDARRLKKVDIKTVGDDRDFGGRRRRKKPKKKQVDLKEVQNNVKKTLASIDTKGKKPKKTRKVKTETGEIIEEKVITVTEFISANDLANIMDVSVAEIITKCLELGLVVSINQRLEIDTIRLLAEEYEYSVEEQYAAEFLEEEEEEEEEEDESKLRPRAPIVTIMGHVDHGKTSLLDHIRESHIVESEAGGITQHIGAYRVNNQGNQITFLDTPGHEAFTAMRARGAQVTDIVILIIAADDAVMPQTDEALDHAKAAGVKIIIAINKIDKPGANAEKIRQQLSERDVLVEDWGGTYQCVEISAMTGQGIPELLEKIQLEAEMLELKANPERNASGFVIESRLDKGKGAIATVLIQNGTLKIGDSFIAGHNYGKVRALLDDHDARIKSVGPSEPALVIGFMGVSQAGDKFSVSKDEKSSRDLAVKRQHLKREQDAKQVKLMTLDKIAEQIKIGEIHDLNLVVKADVDGSAEALADSLIKLNTEEVRVNVVRKAVGPISESDVILASASGAVIIGFHVRANPKAREMAEKENVDIRNYQVIYDAINDIKMAMEGMLAPEQRESQVGQAEVRDTFKISRIGTIAGCHVLSGKITRSNKIRLVRDDVEIYIGNIASLKRFKEDVREVQTGYECGIQIENYNDLKHGDIIEAFEISEVKRLLA